MTLQISATEESLVQSDLERSKRYLRELLASNGASKTVREALTLAAIVTYCRPFKTHRDVKGKCKRLLPSPFADALPADLCKLHANILKQRDQVWAHSDWCQHTPTAYNDVIISRNPWIPLEQEQAQRMLTLIEEIRLRVAVASESATSD